MLIVPEIMKGIYSYDGVCSSFELGESLDVLLSLFHKNEYIFQIRLGSVTDLILKKQERKESLPRLNSFIKNIFKKCWRLRNCKKKLEMILL